MRRSAAALVCLAAVAAPSVAWAGPNDNSNRRPWSLQIGAGPALDIPFDYAAAKVGVDFQYHFKKGDVGPALGGLVHTIFNCCSVSFVTGPMFLWDFRVFTSSKAKLYLAPHAAAGIGVNFDAGASAFFFGEIGGQFKGIFNDRVGFFVRPASFSLFAGPYGTYGFWSFFTGLALSF
ncbi:MAG: hypothetical protein U0168_31825 [Nannocystaceae bacterium]